MKRFLILTITTMMLFSGCKVISYNDVSKEAIKNENDNNFKTAYGYFTKIIEWGSLGNEYSIVYANDTKVKYLIAIDGYRYGITPLYNADGTLQIYEGE